MKRKVVPALAAAVLLILATQALATLHTFDFILEGAQEVPPVATSATGDCTVTLDDVTNFVQADCSFTGLTSPSILAHIHGLSAPGVNSPPIVNLTLTPLGGTSGSATGSGTLTPAQTQGMLDGLTYVNIHSENFTGGEIRGQVVPEPGTLSLIGLGALVLLRRRR